MASRLLHYGLDDLDGGDLRRRAPHGFTRELSRHVFELGPGDDGEAFAGIRYLSRLGDDIVNWAIFEGTEPEERDAAEIARDDAALIAALETLSITLSA